MFYQFLNAKDTRTAVWTGIPAAFGALALAVVDSEALALDIGAAVMVLVCHKNFTTRHLRRAALISAAFFGWAAWMHYMRASVYTQGGTALLAKLGAWQVALPCMAASLLLWLVLFVLLDDFLLLTVPGSPQVTNVAAMTVLGTAADVALVPGLVGAAAEIAAILVIMNLLINRARKRGEHFELHPLDPRYDSTGSKPKLIVALIPMAVLFLLFNIWKLNINICLLCSIALSLVLFWPQLRRRDLKAMLNSGAVDSVPMTMTVAAICGFAGVITNTDAFQSMITAITSISIAPILICWVVVALMCMLTGGSSTACPRLRPPRSTPCPIRAASSCCCPCAT